MAVMSLLLAGACGGSDLGATVGSIDVLHEDKRFTTSVATEGALALVTISKGNEKLLDSVVPYPATAEEAQSGRYSLVQDARLPTGELRLRLEIRPCTGSCPGANVSEFENLPLGPDVCEIGFIVNDGPSTVVLRTPSDAPSFECQLAGG